MIRSTRIAALVVVALYWAMLIAGMALCIAVRGVPADALAAVWAGTVLGTVLGHALALCRVRGVVTFVAVIGTAMFVLPYQELGAHSWHAFVPAALCAYWSLGDRTTLVAFWYPAVLWMLSVLEHTAPDAVPDDTGLLIVGGLAIAFVVFLRAREARRVALWLAVSRAPLATTRPLVVLRERTGPRLSRATWSLVASALAFAGAAWLAPGLWRAEPVPEAPTHSAVASGSFAHGLPCCPAQDDVEPPRARVKEYFHLGHGQDDAQRDAPHRPGIDCRRCNGRGESASIAYTVPPERWRGETGPTSYESIAAAPALAPPPPIEEWTTASGAVGFRSGADGRYQPSAPDTTSTPSIGRVQAFTHAPIAAPARTAAPIAAPARSAAPAPIAAPTRIAAPAPNAPSTPTPPPARATATQSTPPNLLPPRVAPPPSAPAAPPPPPAEPARASPAVGPSLLRIVALALGGLFAVQLVLLALRPLRRLVTLRHLRRPYWQETVDQRVSNAWQLALVGLRDAGWRTRANEPPQELARRVDVDGVEQCATILERAQHGVGLDAGDLAAMTTSADSAYHSARSRVGRVARALSWLRWPLA